MMTIQLPFATSAMLPSLVSVCVCVVYFLVRNFTGDCFFSETESCVFVSLQLQHVGLFESLQLVPARQSKKLKEDGSVNQSSLLILYTAKS
jgi:hypothetical protein